MPLKRGWYRGFLQIRPRQRYLLSGILFFIKFFEVRELSCKKVFGGVWGEAPHSIDTYESEDKSCFKIKRYLSRAFSPAGT